MDDPRDDADDLPGFSDAEIAEQIAPFLEEVDAEYDDQLERLVEVFRRKGRAGASSRPPVPMPLLERPEESADHPADPER